MHSKNTEQWAGPSRVVATSGKKLFIDKGSRLGTVNRDDAVRKGDELWKVNDSNEKEDRAAEGSIAKVLRNVRPKQSPKVVAPVSSSSSESSSSASENDDESTDDEGSVLHSESEVDNHNEAVYAPLENPRTDLSDEYEFETAEEGQLDGDTSSGEHSDDSEDTALEDELFTSPEDIRKNDVIQYVVPETGLTENALVLRRAAKAAGKNRFWWNVQVKETGEMKSVNLETVTNLLKVATSDSDTVPALVVTIPRNLHHEHECVEAKEQELQNWDRFGVYEEVPDDGQPRINTSWVLVRKAAGVVKARLCIRGDQEPNKEAIRTDSPTVNKINIKLFFIISVQKQWHVKTADIKAAFLQGAVLDREVYVRPPLERRRRGILWKMIKRAYGFVDASRGFYLELKKVLEELGCIMSRLDPALFLYFGEHAVLQGLLLAHVDDLIHGAGTTEFEEVVLIPLKQRFTFGSEDEDDFKYVGMHIRQVGNTIVTDQDSYVDNLEIPYLEPNKGKLDDLLDENGQSDFRSAVGRIGWISNSSRPDLAFNHLLLSTKIGSASFRDMKLAAKTIKCIKGASSAMKFVHLGPMDEWVLEGYGDAGHKSLPDKISSSCGYVLLLTNTVTKASSILTWKSTKIRRVVGSSTAAEALATNDTADALLYISAVLKELLGDIVIPLHIYTDSKNLHDSVSTSALVVDHRMRVDIARLKESIEKGEVSHFQLVKKDAMLADVLTKNGAPGFGLMNILRTGKY